MTATSTFGGRIRAAARRILPAAWLLMVLTLSHAIGRTYIGGGVWIVTGVAAISAAGAWVFTRKDRRRFPGGLLPLIGLVAAGFVSAIFAWNRGLAVTELALWISGLLLFWAAAQIDARRLEPLVFASLAALALNGLYQVVWWFTSSQFALTEVPRPGGLTPGPNTFGALMLPALALAYARKRWFWLGVFALTLVISGSRAPLAGLAAGAIMIGVWALRHRGRISWRAVVIGGVVALALIPLLLLQLQNRTHGRLDLRFDLWRVAWIAFRESPIVGIGPGNYQVAFVRYATLDQGRVLFHAHNVYLHVAAELGIVGLIALGGLVWWAARTIRKLYREHPRQSMIAAAFGVSMLVMGIADYVFWLTSCVLFMALAAWLIAQGSKEAVPRPTIRTRLAVGGIIAAGVAVTLIAGLDPILSNVLTIAMAAAFVAVMEVR